MAEPLGSSVENCVSYELYPDFDDIDEAIAEEKLEEFKKNVLGSVSRDIVSYTWQNEAFQLNATRDNDGVRLIGQTVFDESVDDEWFIVLLLTQLTKELPGLVVKVSDDDGDFILIEAADELPDWVNPETAQNRVFLAHGKLHIIPVASNPSDLTPFPSGTPDVRDAVNCVRKFGKVTVAPSAVQNIFQGVMVRALHRSRKNNHHAFAYLPAKAAYVLQQHPQLISHVCRTFCERDLIDAKAFQRGGQYFPPDASRIVSHVRFSRCLYAQISQEKVSMKLKERGDLLPAESDKLYHPCQLGLKLTMGLEILCRRCTGRKDFGANNCVEEEVAFDDRQWLNFKKSLITKGYFMSEIEGSQKYTLLENQAKEFFIRSFGLKDGSEHPGMQVLRLLKRSGCEQAIERLIEDSPSECGKDDDNSWMTITESDIDEMVAESMGKSQKSYQDESSLPDNVHNFLSSESNLLDGAELPGDKSLKFDEDQFMKALDGMLGGDASSKDHKFQGSEEDDEFYRLGGDSSDDDDDEDDDADIGSDDLSGRAAEVDQLKQLMRSMDAELSGTKVGESFHKMAPAQTQPGPERNEASALPSVDIDLNTVQNLMESYMSECGNPGPASILLEGLNIQPSKPPPERNS